MYQLDLTSTHTKFPNYKLLKAGVRATLVPGDDPEVDLALGASSNLDPL